MNLEEIMVYPGRNIYAHFPVVRTIVDLKEYVDIPTCNIKGFNEGLRSIVPGLKKHKCSKGYIGGFNERLNEGTYLAHVLEHTSLEIQQQLGYDVSFGKARYLEKETIYCVVFEYKDKTAAYESIKLAFDIINGLLNNKRIDVKDRLKKIRRLIRENALGPSTQAIVDEAKKRKIPVTRLGTESLIQLGYGKNQKRIQATITENTSCLAVDTACNKELTNQILTVKGIPVPKGKSVMTFEAAEDFIKDLGFPIAIKPYNGNQGKGVSLGINSLTEAKTAYSIARQYNDRVLVEEHISGKNYRVAVVGDKVVAVSQRIAAHVIGDGTHTIQELIKIENQNHLRGEGHEKPLTKIKIDPLMKTLLERKGLSLSYVPKTGQIIFLRENDNLSTGGIAIDATEEIHPDNIKIAIEAAKAIELDIAGIDIVAEDISKSIKDFRGAVIEVNASPGIRMHHYPSKGTARNVAKEIIEMLYPKGLESSIPIISITGTNGKTTTTRMLSNILEKKNLCVGMTTTGGVYIGNELLIKGDTTGPLSAQTVLMDKRVDVAVLETARGGIVNKGLAYDLADIGIITNIGDDHLGVDGINTKDEMANVKSLIAEAVKNEGFVILNADDQYTENIIERVKSHVFLFSMDYQNELLQNHIKEGKPCIYVREGKIYIYNGIQENEVMKVMDIPATYNGLLKYNTENALAAMAAAYVQGVEIGIIAEALKSFNSDEHTNPGRFNVFQINDFKVILDYGHNLDGIEKVATALSSVKENRLIGVIGTPGDRSDINILKVGELCGHYFDQVYVKEDKEKRGRKVGEVANILKKGCTVGGIVENNIEVELCEVKALEKAMAKAEKGDTIVVFYEQYDLLLQTIKSYTKHSEQLKSQVI
ncbi:cyanophycin synthetase [Serpentinicella sp. ANB-PHB4]|uniref:cyanophycin synthetase n=1 Tax=Serpentinicella sp. ANB-PHB4 TaxID=3074076 RepID=UPI002865F59D|nr:cyanophycin synthetase [Serpentinicella sp. ANB-PHB4]MDR5660071.1 cyanophycin synthetase [Serpentinicella sp. ANB-PHB4]